MIRGANGRFDYYSISLKLDRFYCIEAMNELKVICCGLFNCSYKGRLIKMIRVANGRFDAYSISPKIRQILLY